MSEILCPTCRCRSDTTTKKIEQLKNSLRQTPEKHFIINRERLSKDILTKSGMNIYIYECAKHENGHIMSFEDGIKIEKTAITISHISVEEAYRGFGFGELITNKIITLLKDANPNVKDIYFTERSANVTCAYKKLFEEKLGAEYQQKEQRWRLSLNSACNFARIDT